MERLGLLTIIVCGESFVKVSLLAADGTLDEIDIAVLVTMFVFVFGVWWGYFDDVPAPASGPNRPVPPAGWWVTSSCSWPWWRAPSATPRCSASSWARRSPRTSHSCSRCRSSACCSASPSSGCAVAGPPSAALVTLRLGVAAAVGAGRRHVAGRVDQRRRWGRRPGRHRPGLRRPRDASAAAYPRLDSDPSALRPPGDPWGTKEGAFRRPRGHIMALASTDRYTIISADTHAGANHETYREYLDPKYPRRLRRVARQVQEPVEGPARHRPARPQLGRRARATPTSTPTASSAR